MTVTPQGGRNSRPRRRGIVGELFSYFAPGAGSIGVGLIIVGVITDQPKLRYAGVIVLAAWAVAMLAAMGWAIYMGAVIPAEFLRAFRRYSPVEKLVFTPLVALLVLMMLALVAAAVALGVLYARRYL